MLDPSMGLLTFEIGAPDGTVRAYRPQGQATLAAEGIAESVIWLVPGGDYDAAVDLTYEMRGGKPATVLSQPGEYRLRARYSIPKDWPAGPLSLSSDEVPITVGQPQGVDAEAHAALYDCALPYDLRPWNAAKQQQESYERVLRDYPESAYALYARFSLGDILNFDGVHRMRGTPAGASSLERAAVLYRDAAEEDGDTPFGLYALRVAARCFAQLGDSTTAQDLLERSFLSPAATADDRVWALTFMDHVQTGVFRRGSGYGPATPTARLQVPLRRFADALGFRVDWDSSRRAVTASGARAKAVFRPDKGAIVINGAPRKGLWTSLAQGQTLVSPSVIATLMAEQYGTGMAKALAPLLAAAPIPRR
jgi:tetratricopeptide (TPR) repeat protein